jgi:small redox-active disulfide protein 2
MKIEVLGPGCPKCSSLEENVKKALQALNMEATVVKVTDINAMVERGLMQTPGLVIEGKLVMQGKVLSLEQVKELIQKQGGIS